MQDAFTSGAALPAASLTIATKDYNRAAEKHHATPDRRARRAAPALLRAVLELRLEQ